MCGWIGCDVHADRSRRGRGGALLQLIARVRVEHLHRDMSPGLASRRQLGFRPGDLAATHRGQHEPGQARPLPEVQALPKFRVHDLPALGGRLRGLGVLDLDGGPELRANAPVLDPGGVQLADLFVGQGLGTL